MAGTKKTARQPMVSYESRPHITLHEVVIINFSVRNRLSEEIVLDLGRGRKANFTFGIVQPNGSIRDVRATVEGGLSRVGRISVQPGASYSQRLILSELYFFDEPGSYKVGIGLESPVQKADGTVVAVSTDGFLEVQVQSRDEGVLRERCEELARLVEQQDSYQAAEDAAQALSFVIDPVSVPYLERLLASGQWDEAALAGLARIADPAAVSILRSQTQSGSEGRRALATHLLANVEKGVQDPLLRGKLLTLD